MAAMSYYQQAESHATRANELAADVREKREIHQKVQATIDRWDEIMGNTHPVVWGIFFIIISVVEFIFSLDLYTDLLPFIPWMIPLGIIVVTVFISHALAVKVMTSLKNKEFSDKKHNQAYKSFTDERIWDEIHRNSNRNFIIGIIGAVIITAVILFLSVERVHREIGAGMRVESFNVYDLLPVIFYVFEIIAGILVLYLLKRIGKGMRARRLKKQIDGLLRMVSTETKNTIDSFEKAEQNGFDLLANTINESVHIAYYRNKNCNPSDEENFVAEPQNSNIITSIQVSRAKPESTREATIHLQTEYNFTATGKTNLDGLADFKFSSFENDTIKKLIVEFADGTDAADEVNFMLNNTEPHQILFRV
jgi:hypothetical protein